MGWESPSAVMVRASSDRASGGPLASRPAAGFAIAQDVPADVEAAYQRLLDAGFDSRLLRS
ncbi:MAG: hypothetical protein JWL58_2873 [Streptosporangiaceae bacterium]|nr:hypothetical protein [Streptosporangiaceae bacterium]